MKYVLVYSIDGEYDSQECNHYYIAIFPEEATEEEIKISVGDSFDILPVYNYIPTTITKYIQENK